MSKNIRRAVVMLSGGLDSATVLAMARAQGYACHAISFDYGQRHRAELQAAARVAALGGAVEHKVVTLDLGGIGGSALTDESIDVPESSGKGSGDGSGEGIPVTYVPARNTVFLSIAMGWAEVLDAQAVFIGVNAVDYSGYPDCRPVFIEAFQRVADVATKQAVEGRPIRIEAPLIGLSKAEIIHKGTLLGVDYSQTVSCYAADDEGRACGRCDSCHLRKQGFAAAGIHDPTRYA